MGEVGIPLGQQPVWIHQCHWRAKAAVLRGRGVATSVSSGGCARKGARQIHGILHAKELSTVNSVQLVTEIGVAMSVPPTAARKPRQ
jgi:hypothetical protein